MAKNPNTLNINWWAAVLHLVIIAVLIILIGQFLPDYGIHPVFLGLIAYCLIALLLNTFLARYHRRGIKLMKMQQPELALLLFEQSYYYFVKHPLLDRYRSITLFSLSKASYKELAMLNMAYCHLQLNDVASARTTYQNLLAQFPHNTIAIGALTYIDNQINEQEHPLE